MNAVQLKATLSAMFLAKLPALIKGSPGAAKTSVVEQTCEELGADLVVFHPVVSDPTDFKGMPWVENGEAHFLPFNDLGKLINATSLTVAFFDDIGQSPQSVQAACMQLFLARQVNGFKVSEHVVFVAATNRRADKAGVSGILEPLKSRFKTIIELDVDFDAWNEWALKSGKIPEQVIGFLGYRPELLSNFKPTSDLTNSPCPRTWESVGDLFSLGILANKRGRPLPGAQELVGGAVGSQAAAEFFGYLEVYKTLPDLDKVCTHPDEVETPALDSPSVLYATTSGLAYRANKKTFSNIVKYLLRLPVEAGIRCAMDSVKRAPEVQHTDGFLTLINEDEYKDALGLSI